ncbi:MAG: BMP family ABC transporter substrate-binding protein [Lachnospiraceae bacterium]|nr:BMP family ABC transporter substrate-binding protein [Lachnospiraceae bacterium]
MKKRFLVFGGIFIVSLVVLLVGTILFAAKKTVVKEEFKVGLILNGGHDDRGLSEVHYDPLYNIIKRKHMVLEYFENVPVDSTACDKMEELIRDGCSLIVLDSAFYEAYARSVSIEHPDVNFICFYGNSYMDNFLTFAGRLYQAHYLTGIVAGLQTESNCIGFCSQNMDPILITGINAFTIGVKKVNPEAKVYVKISDGDINEKDALDLINNRNVDILACDGVNDSVLKVAEENNVWSIGMHFDNSDRYPNTFLTGALLDFRDFYGDQISRCERGIFAGETLNIGIDDNAVDIVPLTRHVKSGIARVVEQERKLMKERKFDVFYGPIIDTKGDIRVNSFESIPDKEVLYNQDWFVSGVVIDE